MVEINQFGSQNPQGFNNQNQNHQFNQQTSFNQAPPNNQLAPKGLFQIPEKFLQLIPWIPIGLEMLTGQKIPATGVLADILGGIQQLQFQVSQISTQQQQLLNKLTSLENNASQQLTNLSQQVKDFRLLATETKRSLEFNSHLKPELETNYE